MTDDVPDEVEELLTSEPLMAHLATCRDGRPHVAPVWFRYEDGVVELVTTGTKLRNLRENPRVSLSVQKDEGGRARWAVTLLGTAEIVEDEAETRTATREINRKYGAEEDAWSENVLVRVDVGTATHSTYD
ncbi:pyridoxamine 5'-phosphate oxidase family protein [Halogeometricum sp. S1BR25-6]|uniref:Pyridoxamine 5'-phosphate oxidase family protein n=1 Tax=Halogeometricum salsisoli TaxID=2950536 RepID=A0ABU2GG36_9EURY|nr:pyridoxamine 5'-phosphate oxidase family protein [Halogeometricum sp. S1BR25-6]MDS0299771.1 pyridoxamine 5'-phosphate oxidase family protein [Halogeometricum sp. S1BR25-6]